jgi:23S rRNA (guanine2535-N1)-methyltransferase
MEYKYTPSGANYAMYAAGGVFYAAPGHTAFPVRLAVEIYRRCLVIRSAQGMKDPAVVYDPCCGGAYHLATMAYFNWQEIAAIYASDIDEDALGIATRNLSLLTPDGMDRRIAELSSLHEQYGKASHATALGHARSLRQRLATLSRGHRTEAHLFRADAKNGAAIASQLGGATIDVVLTDTPYGRISSWGAGASAQAQAGDAIYQLLEVLLPHLATTAVVAVAAAKKDGIAHEHYRRVGKVSIGKRQVVLLQPG